MTASSGQIGVSSDHPSEYGSPAAHGVTALSAHDERRIAVEARVDPRTVHRFLRGQIVRDLCAVRIQEALERLRL